MDQLATGAKNAFRAVTGELHDLFVDPFSELSWGGALRFVAYGLIVLGFKLGYDYVGERPRLFPRKVYLSRSLRQDVGLILVNSVLAGLLAALFISVDDGIDRVSSAVQSGVSRIGEAILGAAAARVSTHDTLARIVYALSILVAVDSASFFHHYLSHRVPFLWELHKVHHSALVLSPTTFRRFHFFEALMRIFFIAIGLGLVVGVLRLVFGPTPHMGAYVASGAALYHVVAAFTQVLNHSHVWWSWGKLERVLNSPAMHAIHHSRDTRHHDKNFAGIFSFLDTLMGTLYRTTRTPEAIELGVDDGYDWARASQWQLFVQPLRAWVRARGARQAARRGSAVV